MAFEIYKQVKEAIDRINSRCVSHLTMYSQFIELFADVPSYEEALQIAREAKKEADIDGTAWLGEVRQLLDHGVRKQADLVEIQYFAIDNGCLCGVANEIMCEFALRAKECIHNDFFYLGGYTNGCTGYFPTEEEYDQGGYEVYWSMLQYYIYHGRVFPLNRDSASQLIQAAAENIPHYMRR